jgi:hypothetical protein
MLTTFQGYVWAIMVMIPGIGPVYQSGPVYVTADRCEAALKKLLGGYGCNPAPGESCNTAAPPNYVCWEMQIAPHQTEMRP